MEEIREILQPITQSTLATTSTKSSTTDWSRLIARPNIFDHKSREEDREWSWVFEKCLSALDEGYVKDLKEIHEKPNEKFDCGLATEAEKTRCIQLCGLLASLNERKGTAVGESCGGLQWM